MVRVAGTADADWFLRSGRAAYDAIAAHVPLAEKDSVLDFGCGCGRVTRYWTEFAGTVSGGDVSAKAIEWCRVNMPFARFELNRLEPPLAFADESFDLVYALSVFTHLTDELQLDWRDELHGTKFGLSSPMRRASEMGWIKRLVQVGARGLPGRAAGRSVIEIWIVPDGA